MAINIDKIPLRGINISIPDTEREEYPFSVPAIRALNSLDLNQNVTIFVGENGSGKSTLLEAIARGIGIITVGQEAAVNDETLAHVQPLVDGMRLIWNRKTNKGFFLRAEDFFGYVRQVRRIRSEMADEISRIDREYQTRSDYAKSLAKGPALSSINALEQRYGGDLDENSHGESFLTLFQSRLIPGGLYLLDEPEAALSPLRQMGLISMIKNMVEQNAQFIIATHSPILMAMPGAVILDFDQTPPTVTDYDALEHVHLYRSFLEDPEAFIRLL